MTGRTVPDRLELRPGMGARLGLVALTGAFTAGGAAMVREGAAYGSFVLIFFGAATFVALVAALPGAMVLRVANRGLRVTNLYRSFEISFSDVDHFEVMTIGPRRSVVFVLTDAARNAKRGWRMPRYRGTDGALPASYGLEPEELAALLEDWRRGEPRAVDRRSAFERFRARLAGELSGPVSLLALKLAMLFSFAGGPLWLSDRLKAQGAPHAVWLVGFAPIVLMIFGAWSLFTWEGDALDRWYLRAGWVGAFALLVIDVIAGYHLATAPRRPDHGLMVFGEVIGFVTIVVFGRAAKRVR